MRAFTASLFLFTCALAVVAHAQPHAFRVEYLAPPDPRVTAIEQDRQGFMWFGTLDGLYRYDGYTYTAYRNDPSDSTSIAGNYVEELLEDSQGNIWVGLTGSPGGLDRYDPATDSFIHYRVEPDAPDALCSDYVKKLHETRDGTLWVGSFNGGLSRYDRATDTFRCFRFNPDDGDGLSGRDVFTIYEDRQGTLWVGSFQLFSEAIDEEGGLCRFDRETERFTCYRHNPGDEHSLANNNVMSVFEDSESVLWVGTMGHGLHRMDRERGTFTRYPYDPAHPERLSGPSWAETGTSPVEYIYEDRNGLLWTGGAGLCYYDRATGTQSRVEGISWAWEIYEDRTGTIWIGSGGAGGLARIFSTPDLFQVESGLYGRSLLVQERDTLLWIGTQDQGLYALDRAADTPIPYTSNDSSGIQPDNVVALYEDRAGSLWIVDNINDRIDRYDRTSHDRQGASAGNLAGRTTHYDVPGANALFEDREGRIWVGTWGNGLYQLDREGRHIQHFRHDPGSPDSLGSDYISSFYEDPSGDLWIGTDGDETNSALSRFDPVAKTFTNHAPPGMAMVTAIREDAQGRLWVGSRGGGLHLFDRDTGTSTSFREEHGLVDNNVQEVLIDGRGILWISTDRGLSRFDPETQFFSNFTAADGLPSDFFLERSGTIGPGGKMFFGTSGGVVSFFPEHFRTTEAVPPNLLMTDFRLAGKSVSIGPDTPLEAPIWIAQEITLTHKQNDFGFTYAVIYPRSQSSVQYAYMLEGYDDVWRPVGSQRRANFTNLDPGSYVFRVKAATFNRWWDEDGASVGITILAPWWRTWWAYALCGLFFVAGVFAVDRFQRRRLIARERQRAAVERERLRAEAAERELEQAREIEKAYTQLKATQAQLVQQEKMASLGQLTAGIAHEIKNPLNFVNNFAEVNAELLRELLGELTRNPDSRIGDMQQIIEDLQLNEEKIAKHGRRADGIVRNMMEHARGGADERYEVGVNKLVDQYVNLSYSGIQARAPDFEVEIERDYGEAVGAVEMAPREMGRVLMNLLNNAFDALHERAQSLDGSYTPTVKVLTRKVEGQVEIRVSDNGPGIPDQVRDRVFEPFFTTKPAGSGTGLGLSLSYDIVTQGHGGTLTAESDEGGGATFVITLPTGHSMSLS